MIRISAPEGGLLLGEGVGCGSHRRRGRDGGREGSKKEHDYHKRGLEWFVPRGLVDATPQFARAAVAFYFMSMGNSAMLPLGAQTTESATRGRLLLRRH